MAESTTLTRSKIAEAIHRHVGVSLAESGELVDQIIEELIAAVGRGEELKISGFATFAIRQKKQRIGRNPRTKEEVLITPRKVISFRPALGLKRKVNGEDVAEEIDDDD